MEYNKVIRFLVTPDEDKYIKAEARRLHLTVSAFIRLLIRQWGQNIEFHLKERTKEKLKE